MPIDPGVNAYINDHRNGVLATTNRSSTPQQTLITYQFDGENFAISTRADRLKAKNVSRRPDVSMAIIDGGRQLIVYGKATVVRDRDEVFRLHAERIRRVMTNPEPDQELADRLIREDRVTILLTPDRFYPASM